MSDLIVLCPGALLAPPAAPAAASALPAESLPGVLRGATLADRTDDDALVPRELPYEAWLRQELSIGGPAVIEAASAHHDGLADAAQWLRATPVHLHVGLDSLVLTDPSMLHLQADDAAALAAALAPVLGDAGFELQVADPLRWYLRAISRTPDWQARSWRMSVGRSIDVYSPQGPDARLWRKLVNEVQMSWFEHPVNRRREADGLPPVNSLWLDGPVPAGGQSRFSNVVTDDAALAGLAAMIGARTASLADAPDLIAGASGHPAATPSRVPRIDAAASPEAAASPDPAASPHPAGSPDAPSRSASVGGGHTLLVSDAWQESERDPAPAAFADAWRRFGEQLARLGADRTPPVGFEQMRIVLSGERRWIELRASRGDRWRFWRRNDPSGWWEPQR